MDFSDGFLLLRKQKIIHLGCNPSKLKLCILSAGFPFLQKRKKSIRVQNPSKISMDSGIDPSEKKEAQSAYAPKYKFRVRLVNPLGFTAGMQKNKRVGPACFIATKRIWKDTADWKINRLASMQADPLDFFLSANTKEKKPGGLGVNKRNRGYPADFEFIERPSWKKWKKEKNYIWSCSLIPY